MKTLEELKKLDPEKLQKELIEASKDSFKSRFEVENGQEKNNQIVRKKKKQIARIKTLIKEQ